MKTGVEHRVPLSPRALQSLKRAEEQKDGSGLIFPGHRNGRPFSNMVFAAALKRFREPYTAHGFRSSFRDWAEEQTGFPRAVKEMALAHAVGDAVEQAYLKNAAD